MAENRALIPEPVTMYTQTDVKDMTVKDLSQNLVSGDFERQFADRIVEKNRRKRNSFILLSVCVAALAICLVVVTFVREMQIARLRHEVDELTANMIAMSANVKSLNQKIANNKFLNDPNWEDTFFADDVEEEGPSLDKLSGPLEKLHEVTVVLEDDNNLGDDEDMFDDDDEESGHWYQDYDDRRQKIGSAPMVHLKPEDFTDSVLQLEKEKSGMPDMSTIRQLSKLLNENPENPDIAGSIEGAKVIRQPSQHADIEKPREKRSLIPEAPPELLETPAPPRSFSKEEERRKTKKYIPGVDAPSSISTPTSKVAIHTVTRRSDDEGTRRRPFIAAHFHGNTSHLSPEIHEHYKGNGLIRLSHGAAHDVWYPAPWTAASPHPRPTLMRNGHVHVHHSGIYLVYVQIYYLDSHDIISWVLHRTNPETEGRETLLQCAQSSHSAERMDKPNSCFSAAALFLKAGDRLAVRNTGGDRHSLMEPEKSFIGLIKLADAEDPNEEF